MRDGLGAIILSLQATVFFSVLAIAVSVWWAKRILNRLETTDPAPDRAPDPELVGKMMQREGRWAQGLLASVSIMKPGRFGGLFRRLALRLAFWFIAESASRFSRPGYLGSLSDIHFARWFLLPGSDKLFFWSNYDGAWESYIEDFIQLGHNGVSAIWSNTTGFPRTRNLFQGGASDGDRLRRWARRQMYPPQFWYCAYPDLTLQRIRCNAAIRQGIASAQTDAEATDWLSLFGSAPEPQAAIVSPAANPPAGPPVAQPVPTLDKPEIPTLVFGGRRHMPHALCLVITMSDSPEDCRAWLRKIEPCITYGEDRRLSWALVLALSSTGLDKLGLPKADLDTFPAPFRNGMTASWRSVALGDIGKDAPSNWDWGNKIQGRECNTLRSNPPQADAVVLIYATSARELQERNKWIIGVAVEKGQRISEVIQMQTLPPANEEMREPFGFVDGISQPLLRDTPRARAASDVNNTVEPGEFILGYPDNSGFYPSTPSVRAELDPDHLLGECTENMPEQRPAFGRGGSDGRRDLGRNGTFLVIRQLEQYVEEFNQWLDHTATQSSLLCDRVPDLDLRRELIAAKLIGRWRLNGTSLFRHPERPGEALKENSGQ